MERPDHPGRPAVLRLAIGRTRCIGWRWRRTGPRGNSRGCLGSSQTAPQATRQTIEQMKTTLATPTFCLGLALLSLGAQAQDATTPAPASEAPGRPGREQPGT